MREDQRSEAGRAEGPGGVGSLERGERCAAARGEERVAELGGVQNGCSGGPGIPWRCRREGRLALLRRGRRGEGQGHVSSAGGQANARRQDEKGTDERARGSLRSPSLVLISSWWCGGAPGAETWCQGSEIHGSQVLAGEGGGWGGG